LPSCQKTLKINYGATTTKQVIIANLRPDEFLEVNISKSKSPNDFSPVEFQSDCQVNLYENDVFIETLPFILRDTLSGLGYYTSTQKLLPNKTYRIVSKSPTLETAEATEYLPALPSALVFLMQHADSNHTNITGRYGMLLQDSAGFKNYYFVRAFYKILKPVTDSVGNITYKYDYLNIIPSYSVEIPNPAGYPLSFFTDETFDGQTKSATFDFSSMYDDIYKEITLLIEVSNTGKNFYDWNTLQINYGIDYLNDGQLERTNLKSNIINGYGHFTANSSVYFPTVIK
jgi:hypothetical protein